MKQKRSPNSRVWVVVGGAGVVLGLVAAWACLAVLMPSTSEPPDVVAKPKVTDVSPVGPPSGQPGGQQGSAPECAAMRYARAVQAGDADEMMRSLLWVSERLERVALETSDPTARQAAREQLAQLLLQRDVEGNQLRPEGIEDHYVFVPGAVFELVEIDEGRVNLERPTKERAWIRVIYPRPNRSPLDRNGQAIHSLVVGVNVDKEERVLKAGILGNLDIDQESVDYWASAQGE